MKAGIYKITCKPTGKFYIGSSTNVRRRQQEHLSMLKLKTHHSPYLQHSWDKYGAESFEFETIEKVEDFSQLIVREQHWMDLLDSYNKAIGFNVAPKADSSLGRKHTPEAIVKIKRAAKLRKRRKHTPESIEKMREAARERSKSEAYIERQRWAHIGRRLTPEHRTKIGETRKRKRIPASNKGVGHTQETKDKISKALKKGARKGEESHKAKLTKEKVRKIRQMSEEGLTNREIAEKYGVSRAAIHSIVKRKSWKHVE